MPEDGDARECDDAAEYAGRRESGEYTEQQVAGESFGGGCGEVLEEPGAGRKASSRDEYAKYLKGLGRVDDAAALGKVDYDEVLRVRKEGVGGGEMPEIISKFNYKSKYDEVEFATQLKNQEKGLNDLTISEFVENRRNYNELGRSKKATNLQKELREQFKQDKIEELLKTGSSYEDAVNEAEKWMKTQAVLHDPDQIAGGNPMNLNGLGDKNINSSIGSQWRYRIDDLEKQIMDFANTIPKGEWGNVKLNIKLTY